LTNAAVEAKFLKAIFAVFGIAFLGSCTPNVPLIEQIRALGELRVVTQNAPTTYYFGANERHGIEYELARAFADHLGVRLRIHTVDQVEQILPRVASKKAHIAAAGLTATDSAIDAVDFGPVYQDVTARLIYRMGAARPESLEDVIGRTLEVQTGSSHVDLLAEAARRNPDLAWAEYRSASAEPLLQRVADGTVDHAIVNSNEFDLLRHYYPEVRAVDLDYRGGLAWALPAEARELREQIGEFFARIEATGELDEILDRYYVSHRDLDFVGSRSFVRHLNDRLPALRESFLQAGQETGIDWKLLAAIAYQESHWDPEAVSHTGVEGLMMLTVNTARIVEVEDRSDPHQSILGGARYLARVIDKFPDRIPDEDRTLMAIAAYNLGFGHVEDARIITESKDADKDSWEDVRTHLPLLADERWYPHLKRGFARGSVSVQYVDNVRHYYWLLDRWTGTELYSAIGQSGSDPREPI
jgi:membrane-bound lytic murein transglycosylase F